MSFIPKTNSSGVGTEQTEYKIKQNKKNRGFHTTILYYIFVCTFSIIRSETVYPCRAYPDERKTKKVRTREEVDFQWTRVALSAGLHMIFLTIRGFTRSSSCHSDSRVSRELHQDHTWWCQRNHTTSPHFFHYETYPQTRQVH
jgi:hypothetical protein